MHPNKFKLAFRTAALGTTFAMLAVAQPAALTPPQLDQLVSRIALYPDPLLAQVLTASTYWDEIPDAATWADQHSYLMGDALAAAIQEDHLTWDSSILALLPFPSVLDMMASDPAWTQQLGNAVLTERDAVMDAVQRMRHKAQEYGYLQANSYFNVVDDGSYIEILPLTPGVVYVPQYDPLVVFARPAHGLVIGGAIRFGPGITISAAFAPWGWHWGEPAFAWRTHTILIDHIPVMDYAERNAAKRFIALIDTLYDNAVKLMASAEADPVSLYRATEGYEANEFKRTSSRLIEMSSESYLALPHGHKDSAASGSSTGLVET